MTAMKWEGYDKVERCLADNEAGSPSSACSALGYQGCCCDPFQKRFLGE